MTPVLRTRCETCGTKWYFEDRHLARPDVDPTVCARCGGRLQDVADEIPAAEPDAA